MNTLDRQVMVLLKVASKNIGIAMHSGDEVKNAIVENSVGAAASSLAAGFLPGLAAVAATAVSAGFIWRMYYKINQALGISISKNVLKSLASGLLTNLVAGLGGVVVADAAATALSLLPGLGSISASVLLAAVNYGLVYVSGLVYMKMLTGIFQAKADISKMTESEIYDNAVRTFAQNKQEFQDAFNKAKKSAKKDIKSGKITKHDRFDPGMEENV